MDKDERKEIYFSFFSQLLPEHAEKAKANYNEGYAFSFPLTSPAIALLWGFDWEKTPEPSGYWSGIYGELLAETYPLQLTPQVCEAKAKEVMYGAIFPEDDSERQKYPLAQTDLFFPDADAAFSNFCLLNQQKHCPEADKVTWARDKSIGDGSQLRRHLLEFLKAVESGDMETADKEIKSVDWRGRELHQRWIKKMPPFDNL